MFGSNDKNPADSTQPSANDPAPAMPSSDGLSNMPPDHLITPTAPPLNDSSAPPADESVLPPPAPTPEIIADASKSKATDIPLPAPTSPVPTHDENQLMDIKQQALTNLAPMVHQLDQTPEEKFKTTMMLIQASDNSALIKDAYEAANAITDEKARAHALLDVVNEINYFTQHPENTKPA